MKSILSTLSFFLLVAGAFTACDEVEEASKYDNWQVRNEAFTDSIKALAGTNIVSEPADADNMELGKWYAIFIPTTSTSTAPQYVYCRKLVKNADGQRPNYTGENSSVSAFYYGTLITGDSFDGNFDGYKATDREIISADGTLLPENAAPVPTVFDSPSTFAVSQVIAGWTYPLQYIRTGERWMLYIPWQSGYGSSDSGSIPAYSMLVFDLVVESLQ